MLFDMGQVMAFELRRGGEDSASPEYLKFSANVDRFVSDELVMNFEFESPQMVSIGSQPDVVVCEVRDASFFSQMDGVEALPRGQ